MTTVAVQSIQAAAIFIPASASNGSIKLKENELNGLYPFFLHGFLNFERAKDGKPVKATTLIPADSQNLKNINLKEFLQAGRLVGLIYKQGKIENVCVHPILFKKIHEENALDLALKMQDKYVLRTLDSDKISLVNLNETAYLGMIKTFFDKKQS